MHHFDALKNDLIRIVYDAYDLVQRSLLMAAAAQPEGLAVYSSVFMFRSWEPPKDLSYKMKRYLNKKTKFRFTSGLDVTPYMHLGEMYIRFTKGLETTKIQLAELERI
ncbi:hypothetical protein [Chitinophaga arvensicola]|nr:hypothetical protein [Chitinophaga arvensicola]